MQRILDRELLKNLIREMGLAEVSIATEISISTLEKLRAGAYGSELKPRTINKLSKGLNVSKDALFPVNAGRAS